jgi:hypothetical protein
MARANSDACGVVGVMWNLWRRRRDSGTPHSSLYARSENSRRNSVLWGLGPSRPKLVALGGACADYAQTTVPASPTSNASLCECMHLTTHRTRTYRRQAT